MSMNSAPSGVRTHIGLFGRRNAGKSSLVNALTGQNLAIVSEVKGTTTDPVVVPLASETMARFWPVRATDELGFACVGDQTACGCEREQD